MPLTEAIVVPAVGADGDFNVKIVLSNCEVTSIGLLAQLHNTAEAPVLILPYRKNGTTRCKLDPGHYVFVLSYENIDAPSTITLAVKTGQSPSSIPEPIPPRSGNTAEKRSFATDVFV